MLPVLEGVHCTSVEQALAAYDNLNSKVVAVKSQIHAGGRGKGTLYHPQTREEVMQGGVKIAFSRDEVETYSTNILGNVLVTIQTGDEGKVVKNLYVESGCDIAHEYYLALLVDRDNKSVLIMASTEGGVDIEHVAEHTPEKIHKVIIDVNAGLLGFQKRDLGLALGLSGMSLRSFGKSLSAMYEMFVSQDCAMVEINPLVKSKSDEIIALGKLSLMICATLDILGELIYVTFQKKKMLKLRAKETGLSYVKLDGNIGCISKWCRVSNGYNGCHQVVWWRAC